MFVTYVAKSRYIEEQLPMFRLLQIEFDVEGVVDAWEMIETSPAELLEIFVVASTIG